LADPIAVQSFVQKYDLLDKFEAHSLAIYQSDIFIMLSKKTCNENDVDRINQAILALKKEKKLTQILQNWSAVQ
jgi:hypothetical protein